MTYLFHKRSCERHKSNQQKTGDQLEERNLAKLLLWDIQPKPVENAPTIQAHIVEANMTIISFLWYFHILSKQARLQEKTLTVFRHQMEKQAFQARISQLCSRNLLS